MLLNLRCRNRIPILISEDGESLSVKNVISEAASSFAKIATKDIPFIHVHNPTAREYSETGYFALSRHFNWALNKVLSFLCILFD